MYVTYEYLLLHTLQCYEFRASGGQDGDAPRTNPYYRPIFYTSNTQFISALNIHFAFSLASKVGDTARDMAVGNGYKKIAKLLAPARGDTLKVSGSLTLKKISVVLDFRVSVWKEFLHEECVILS